MRADVVPEVGVVLHHAASDHELDLALPVVPVPVRRRHADARELPEDRRARRLQAGPVAAPERRVRAQREQHGHVDAHAVGDVDRLVGVVHADVDVHAEDQLLARDEAQRGDEVAVARARDDPLVLPHRERMRARRADRQAAVRGRLAHLGAQQAQLLAGLAGRRARLGRDLEHGLHELGLDVAVGAPRRWTRRPRAATRSR